MGADRVRSRSGEWEESGTSDNLVAWLLGCLVLGLWPGQVRVEVVAGQGTGEHAQAAN